uniref:Uncharacterized protein n=1 Tax=Glossina morsitans morsitans TaxID=37546 RepID=A0A1B0FJC0_GLOMM
MFDAKCIVRITHLLLRSSKFVSSGFSMICTTEEWVYESVMIIIDLEWAAPSHKQRSERPQIYLDCSSNQQGISIMFFMELAQAEQLNERSNIITTLHVWVGTKTLHYAHLETGRSITLPYATLSIMELIL